MTTCGAPDCGARLDFNSMEWIRGKARHFTRGMGRGMVQPTGATGQSWVPTRYGHHKPLATVKSVFSKKLGAARMCWETSCALVHLPLRPIIESY